MASHRRTNSGNGGAIVDVIAVNAKVARELLPDEGLLAAFVYPLSPEQFKSRYFRTKCLHLSAGGSQAAAARMRTLLQEHLHGGDVAALAADTASDQVHCWLRVLPEVHTAASNEATAAADMSRKGRRRAGGAVTTGGGHATAPTAPGSAAPAESASTLIETIKFDDATDALVAHRAGASLYMRSPQAAADAYVPAMAECLGMGLAAYYDAGQREAQGEIEVFASRAGHVTQWHHDFQENFTVQLRGCKRWRLRRGGEAGPLRGATPHYRTPADVVELQVKSHRVADGAFQFAPPAAFFEGGAVEEVVLMAGDCFYFPAGAWHQVSADSDSLSINISLVGATWADVGARAVQHALWRHDAWRQIVTLSDCAPASALSGSQRGSAGTPARTATGSAGASSAGSVATGRKRKRGEDSNSSACGLAVVASSSGGGRGAGAAPSGGADPSKLALDYRLGCPGLYQHMDGLLGHLRDAVAALRPEHLLPPAALLSRRFAADVPADAPPLPNTFELTMGRGGQLLLTVPDAAAAASASSGKRKPGKRTVAAGSGDGSAAADSGNGQATAATPNPLAVVIRVADLAAASDAPAHGATAGRQAHVHEGCCGSDDEMQEVAREEAEDDGPNRALKRARRARGSRLADSDGESHDSSQRDREEEDVGGIGSESSSGGHSHSGEASSDEDEDEDERDPMVPPGFTGYIVHVNFGARDDLASLCRTLVHVPAWLAPAAELVVTATSGPPRTELPAGLSPSPVAPSSCSASPPAKRGPRAISVRDLADAVVVAGTAAAAGRSAAHVQQGAAALMDALQFAGALSLLA
jgi:hypothetical protein